eukprot:TRINITY_DN9278_c0_g1_i2.p2 TRINITY_DN9278_c0_g1~~TRINITY_DN9278_c0_g1_i2.p2  ORF type:complete len:129 (+),score=6.25 TRINITY_DN9278_c0_g1_i2:72-458(+)
MCIRDSVCSILNKGVEEISEVLKINRIDNEDAVIIGELLKTNTSLTELTLGSFFTTDRCVVSICKGLKRNKTLKKLNIGYTRMKNEGMQALRKALSINNSLMQFGTKNYDVKQGIRDICINKGIEIFE